MKFQLFVKHWLQINLPESASSLIFFGKKPLNLSVSQKGLKHESTTDFKLIGAGERRKVFS